MVQIALTRGEHRVVHLVHLRGCRQRNAAFLPQRERDPQILELRADPRARFKVAFQHPLAVQVKHAALCKTA